MKLRSALLVTAAIAAFTFLGCSAPSVNPLVSDSIATTDEGLSGTWHEADSTDNTYVVTPVGDKQYRLTMIPEDGDAHVSALAMRLAKVGGETFVQIAVTQAAGNRVSESAPGVVMPVYQFMKFERAGDTLNVWFMSTGWLKELSDKGVLEIAHTRLPDDPHILLTASTEDLQKFHTKHLKTEGAWDGPHALVRGVAPRKPKP
ncbi:hypothetical protein PHYC_01697 [Phycisphaerales bacterium]|nr:hypothetical protein PHYC_01697 [Phycisphaerales bacterium]